MEQQREAQVLRELCDSALGRAAVAAADGRGADAQGFVEMYFLLKSKGFDDLHAPGGATRPGASPYGLSNEPQSGPHAGGSR